MTFTIFTPESFIDKVPISTGDVFHFKNIEVDFRDAHKVFTNNFVLSRPLIKETIAKRRAEELGDLYDSNCGYIVLDIDKVYTEENVEIIIDYFKNNNYNVNIFKSRSYAVDGKFHMKAIMQIETEATKTMLDAHINFLKSNLDDICDVDNSSTSRASFQAPCYKDEQLYFNDQGICISEDLLKEFIYTPPQKFDFEFDKESKKWFWDHMILKYGAEPKASVNQNGSINIALPSESKSRYSYFWFPDYPWMIQHPNRSKSINMFSEFMKSDEGKLFLKEKNISTFKEYFDLKKGYNALDISERYITVDSSVIDIISQFDSTKKSVLAVKGIMGGGKSNITSEFNRNHKKTLFITMRRTLSYDMLEKYSAKHYLEHLGDVEGRYRQGDNLIIQVDSIHKINPDFFDYVVIDEFESLCLYTQNSMSQSKNYVKNMRILYRLFNSDKKFIVMDTFINNFSLNNYFSNRNIFLINNHYKDDPIVYTYSDRNAFVSVLEHKAKGKNKDEVITCSFGTLAEMKAVESILSGLQLTTVSLSGESTDEFKKMLSDSFKSYLVNYDIVLFSPTITVGVSILNNVKHHFHYDEGRTIDPISSVQMLKRSRNAEYIHAYIKGDRFSQKSYDVEVLNNKVKAKFQKYHVDGDLMLFYNSDTNDVSDFGKFVNRFVAHKNFYGNNHRETCMFMLGIQFENIVQVDDKMQHNKFSMTLKKIRSRKAVKALLYNGEVLDIMELDELNESTNSESMVKKTLLEIKSEFMVLDDKFIYEIYNNMISDKKFIEKIKLLYFYTLSPDIKKKMFEEYVLGNQREIITDESTLSTMKFLLTAKLQDLYTKKEYSLLKSKEVFGKIGYMKRNGCLKLNPSIKNIVNVLLQNKYVCKF